MDRRFQRSVNMLPEWRPPCGFAFSGGGQSDNLLKKGADKAAVHVDLRDAYKTRPVQTKGRVFGTGDKILDGEVDNAIELADRPSKSAHVRQSVIRYAFRYFMVRNEF